MVSARRGGATAHSGAGIIAPFAARLGAAYDTGVTLPGLPVQDILRIAHANGARAVRVFGSRARGEAGPDSDLDLLVTLEPGRSLLDLIAIKQDLEALLRLPVDVVTENGLSPYVRARVLEEARSLS